MSPALTNLQQQAVMAVDADMPDTAMPLPGRFDAQPPAAAVQPLVDVAVAQDAPAPPGAQICGAATVTILRPLRDTGLTCTDVGCVLD